MSTLYCYERLYVRWLIKRMDKVIREMTDRREALKRLEDTVNHLMKLTPNHESVKYGKIYMELAPYKIESKYDNTYTLLRESINIVEDINLYGFIRSDTTHSSSMSNEVPLQKYLSFGDYFALNKTMEGYVEVIRSFISVMDNYRGYSNVSTKKSIDRAYLRMVSLWHAVRLTYGILSHLSIDELAVFPGVKNA